MRQLYKYSFTLIAILTASFCHSQDHKIQKLKITILSTMLADQGIGEWGFSALVEFDGKKLLFDTGARPETVLANAKEMNLDLSDITDVFISHNHGDHTGGLINLRKAFLPTNPSALSVVHAGEGIFYERLGVGDFAKFMAKVKTEFELTGGRFIIYGSPKEIYPGVWITGPVPRKNDERNWSGVGKIRKPTGEVLEDNIPEDQSLVFDTTEGLIIISGCGHAGIINTIEYTRQVVQPGEANTLIGGFHLFNLSDEKMKWTTDKLKSYGLQNFVGAHCTGINAVYTIQKNLGLDRKHAVVGAVGAVFELGKGISPGQIAK